MQYIVPERRNLFHKARIMYRDKLLHGSGIQPVLVSSTHPVRTEDIQPHGWTLKQARRPPGYSPEIGVGVCAPTRNPYPISKQIKYVIFPTLFQS